VCHFNALRISAPLIPVSNCSERERERGRKGRKEGQRERVRGEREREGESERGIYTYKGDSKVIESMRVTRDT